MGEVKRRHGHWGGGGECLLSQVALLLKYFHRWHLLYCTFPLWTSKAISIGKSRLTWLFSQLKNKHCNINIEVSFFLPYGREILRTVHWDKTNVKKFSFGQNKRYKKMYSFSFRSPNSSFLTGDSYMSWSTKFFSLKICVGFSIFDSVLILLNFIFLFNQKHLKIKIIENPHAILPSSLWFLSSNKFENLKIKNETNFLNSKIWSFE